MEIVCLIGKPNVGKSTIFNRLIKEKRSIILDSPGITRDRIYGTVNYLEKSFHLIDTGGLTFNKDKIDEDILMQATLAIEEANKVLFVVDGLDELTQTDYYIKDLLQKAKKDVYVVVNKLDNETRKENIYNFYELGFEKLYPVSAEHNLGFKELLVDLTENMQVEKENEKDHLSFCFVGRPNVGKSSLVNALLNEERVLVDSVGGTTRDSTDTTFKYNNETYTVIDTAGMRKKGRIYENVERYSLLRSLKAIDRSDVCVLVLSREDGIVEHDKHIASYILDANKALVVVVNKWDLEEDPNTQLRKYKEQLQMEFKFIPYVSYVFLSATTKKRMHTLMPEVIKAFESTNREIKTSLLNKVIEEAYYMHQPPTYKNKRLKIYFVSQTGTKPPKFTFSVNDKKLIHFSYERYLENKIRENFDFSGTPIILQFKNRGKNDQP